MNRRPALGGVSFTGVFLWCFVICVGLGIYLYRVDILWTVLLVMCGSLFLGLFTFGLILEHVNEKEATSLRLPDGGTSTGPPASTGSANDDPQPQC